MRSLPPVNTHHSTVLSTPQSLLPGTPIIPDRPRGEVRNENFGDVRIGDVRSGVLTEEGDSMPAQVGTGQRSRVPVRDAPDHADQRRISYKSCKREFLHKASIRLDG